MKQTKIEHLPLFDALVNVTVLPEDELRLSKQNRIIYNRLLQGKATNDELMQLSRSRNISARISDVRDEVEKFGWKLEKLENLGGRLNLYGFINAYGDLVTN